MTQFWRGTPVFVTGHTGFKGSWLSLVLARLGADVHGFSVDVPTRPAMFDVVGVSDHLVSDVRADVRTPDAVRAAMAASAPRVVFHLAAQPLVLAGYDDPVATFDTNVMGTVRVLDAVRDVQSVDAVVVVTSDKCYDAASCERPLRESDRLGGDDPYSASKAATELVVHAYRAGFGAAPGAARIASVRAGNVIGGGDWAANRLVPDCMRAFAGGVPVVVRRPGAVRPWQHVLEPLTGYLGLAERLAGPGGDAVAGGWNFGPDDTGEATVRQVVQQLAERWGADAAVQVDTESSSRHETAVLRLDSTQAREALGWSPRWGLDDAIRHTVDWYRAQAVGGDVTGLTFAQIDEHLGAR